MRSAMVGGAAVRSAMVLAVVLSAAVVSAAQHEGHQPAPSRPAAKVEPTPQPAKVLGWEPIRCWRQSSAGAVTIGETFTIVLTCAVYEGDNAQVVPDESRLGVASIQMAPFEILGGAHPPDVHRDARRFFQYDYQLRIISPDAVGRDVNIPPLSVSYRIRSRVGAASTLEGRDLSYLMPMMPIKVLSLVPADAADIRDSSDASLGAVESLRFRSSLFNVLTLTFGALAVLMAMIALVPVVRVGPAAADGDRNRVPDRAILACAVEELTDVQTRAGRSTWSDDITARALAAIRLIAAVAADHPVSQKPLPAGAHLPEGRLLARHGLLRKITAVVSSAVTSHDVTRARASDGVSTTRQQQLEGLASALSTMTEMLYRKERTGDGAAADELTRQAIAVARDLAVERSWWRELAHRYGLQKAR